MGWFMDLPMKKKLLAAFSLLAGINVLLILLGAWVINSLADRQKQVFAESVTLVINLQKLDAQLQENRTRILNMVLTHLDVEKNIQAIEEDAKDNMELVRFLAWTTPCSARRTRSSRRRISPSWRPEGSTSFQPCGRDGSPTP
jgi:hypothetical protein